MHLEKYLRNRGDDMPYKLSKLKTGKKKYVMTNKNTGKSYHYSTAAARKKGMRMHEAFKHGFKMTRKRKR